MHIDEKGAWKYKENMVCGGVMRKKVGHIGAMGLKLAKGGSKWSAVDMQWLPLGSSGLKWSAVDT